MLERLRAAVRRGVELQLLQRVPHLVLLSEAYYQAEMRPLLADWMLPWLRRQGVRDITDEQMLVAIHTPSAVSAAVQQVLGDRHIKMLNLAADWLNHLLPHALRKVNRVHYGLLRPHEIARYSAAGRLPRSRRFLAVPFVGKDAPSHASEYAHPDIAIGLATLAYRYEGMRPADFGAAIHHLRAELDSEIGEPHPHPNPNPKPNPNPNPNPNT